MLQAIKTTKAYFQGYKIAREDGKFFIAEYSEDIRAWRLEELDEFGDIYGYKEWVDTCDTLKDCKFLARYCV